MLFSWLQRQSVLCEKSDCRENVEDMVFNALSGAIKSLFLSPDVVMGPSGS